MQGLTTHFFPLKELQHQKIYLGWGLFNPWDSNIREFVFCVKNIIDYLEHFYPYGKSQGLPDDEMINWIKCEKNWDGVQPKIYPTISFSGMYQKSFIYRRNRTNSQ